MRVGYAGSPTAGSAGTPPQQGDINNAASVASVLDSLMVGRYNSTLPTLTDTRYNALQVSSRGLLQTLLTGSTGNQVSLTNPSDGDATNALLWVASRSTLYNGGTWDFERNNSEGTLLASATRAATTNSADQTNFNARGVYVGLNVTAVPGGDTITFSAAYKDPVSGTYRNVIVGAALATTGYRSYLIYPGAVDSGTQLTGLTGLPMVRTWRITVTHSAASNFDYSVSYALIL